MAVMDTARRQDFANGLALLASAHTQFWSKRKIQAFYQNPETFKFLLNHKTLDNFDKMAPSNKTGMR
jgi:hypothetical protein